MEVPFKNPETGEIKSVKVGWSWTLFLFSGFLGVPLFMRGLNFWGSAFAAMWFLNILVQVGDDSGLILLFCIFALAAEFWIGVKGNELTAKHYLSLGWEFSDPNSDAARFAKMHWGLNGAITAPVNSQ